MKPKPGTHAANRRMWVFLLSMVVIFALGSTTQPAQALMAGLGLTWSVWPTAPVRLVVCWENPSAADPLLNEADQTSGAQRREWARLAVKHSWERYARVILVGWGQCQDEANAVTPPYTLGPRRPGTADENLKVTITFTGSSSNWGHGSWGDYKKEGLRLNLHCGGQSCIEYLAIHEFGHTLGFYHGEERSDWPTNIAGCPRQTYNPSDPWWPVPTELLYGAPDRASVMAYCSGAPTSLSPQDVSGVQRVYTRRQPGTLLSVPGSLCLSSHANGPNGEAVFGWECDEANNDQEWKYDRGKSSLSIVWPADPLQKQRCLDVDTNTNSKLQLWDCHYGANQQWSFRRVEIRGYGGLCLTRPNVGVGPVSMQACSGSAEQLWNLLPGALPGSFQVKSASASLCLVTSGAAASAAAVEPCISGPKTYLPLINKLAVASFRLPSEPSAEMVSPLAAKGRDFYLVPGGQLGVPTSGPTPLCLDVLDVWDSDYRAGKGGPVAGQAVQVFACHTDQLNQRWNLSGDLTSGNKCLAITGSRTTNGAGATLLSCNNGVEQDWDYYW